MLTRPRASPTRGASPFRAALASRRRRTDRSSQEMRSTIALTAILLGFSSLRFCHLRYCRPGGRRRATPPSYSIRLGRAADLRPGQEEDRVFQSRLPDRRRPGRDRERRLQTPDRALRQSGHAHRPGDDPRAGGAALLRSGPAPRLCVQPRRGRARVPQGAGDRSDLRHVLLGRGLRAGPQHQLPDAARGRGTGLRGDRPGHGAQGWRQRARAGADRGLGRTLLGRSRRPTARRSMRPTPTP